MSFVQRNLKVAFALDNSSIAIARDNLASGTFNQVQPGPLSRTGNNVILLDNLRMSARITKSGMLHGDLDIRVYGLRLSVMNQLNRVGVQLNVIPPNLVEVYAGDDTNGYASVFQGTFQHAFMDARGAPDVAFLVHAKTGAYESGMSVAPSSYSGPVDVATILKNLAAKMSLTFENHLTTPVILRNPYLPGSPRNQALAAAYAAGVVVLFDDDKLVVYPQNGARGTTALDVNPQSGMKGYPTFDQLGIVVDTLFNRGITMGGIINVTSSVTPANGPWVLYRIDHYLESQVPNGQWLSTLYGYRPGQAAPVVQ